jgi:lysophospholipase L1-like esterase
VIKNTYLQSIKEGDRFTDFIDGKMLFGDEDYDACTVDSVHPNDLGFYRMAKTIYPYVKKFIK